MEAVRALTYGAARRYSLYNRRRKASIVIELIEALEVSSVLFVGVGSGEEDRTNLFESLVAATAPSSIGAGLGPIAPDFVTNYLQADGLALPFADRSFDLVISNAVIEHVGFRDEQERFVAEHLRVGRAAVLTTPNRHFPIEAHTGTLLRHVKPGWRDADGYVTRLLSKHDFELLLPSSAEIKGHRLSPTMTALISSSGPIASVETQVQP